jgi:hypothetical protein
MIRTLHQRIWRWIKGQIAQDVPASDGLCEYDCRKQQCSDAEWAACERRIERAAGELWPKTKPVAAARARPPALIEYRSVLVSQSDKEQLLSRLKCAHCQSLFNCEGLVQAVLAELRHSRMECRKADNDSPVTDREFIEVVRRGIDSFLSESFGSEDNSESPPAA